MPSCRNYMQTSCQRARPLETAEILIASAHIGGQCDNLRRHSDVLRQLAQDSCQRSDRFGRAAPARPYEPPRLSTFDQRQRMRKEILRARGSALCNVAESLQRRQVSQTLPMSPRVSQSGRDRATPALSPLLPSLITVPNCTMFHDLTPINYCKLLIICTVICA